MKIKILVYTCFFSGNGNDNHPDTSSGLYVEWICLIIILVGLAVVVPIFIFKRTLFKHHTGSCRNGPELGKIYIHYANSLMQTASSILQFIKAKLVYTEKIGYIYIYKL